jgi:hypothetical protein
MSRVKWGAECLSGPWSASPHQSCVGCRVRSAYTSFEVFGDQVLPL